MEIDSHTPLKNPKIINKKIPTAIPYGLVLRVPGFERNDGSQVLYHGKDGLGRVSAGEYGLYAAKHSFYVDKEVIFMGKIFPGGGQDFLINQ